MLFTLEMAKETVIGNAIINANLDLLSPKHCFLSIYLLQEKYNENTKWKHYLNILPKSYNNFPIFYSSDEFKLLRGSPFLQQINDKLRDIEADFKMITNISNDFKKFSLTEFSEMRMAVSSRIFGIKVNGKKTDCFAPLADMLNHKRPRQTQWYYSDEHKSFVIQALQEIQQGDQIYDSYGRKCNSRFLLNYGFVVLENESNEYPFSVEFLKESPFYAAKLNFIPNKNNLKRTFRVVEGFTQQIVIDFFSYLRFIHWNEDINTLINVSLCLIL
jgi:histone-lysine N-methyltransferase SETD3